MNAYADQRRGRPRPTRREMKRIAKAAALALASPAPAVWYKPWTWGPAARVTLAPAPRGATLSGDPFYNDESRTSEARRSDVAPEAIWRARGADTRDRARDATLRDPHAWSLVDKLAGNLVSTGIHVEWSDKALAAAWKGWAETAFVGGWSFTAGTEQAAWSWVESGEVLAIRQWRPDLLPGIPMRVKLVEADLINADMPDESRADGSRRIDGIEIDRYGEVTGYWILAEHPRSTLWNQARTSSLVPARDVRHLFWPRRPSQRRGITDLVPVLDDLSELDDYENAEGMRKTLDSCVMGVVEPGADDDPAANAVTGETASTSYVSDMQGKPVGGLMQGSFVVLRGGKKITFHAPSASQGYEEYKRSKLRSIGAGCGVMYEHLSGDLSQVNYSSFKAGNNEFRRRTNARRANYLIPRLHAGIAAWFVEAALVAGLVRDLAHRPKFTAPRWESVDPAKDAAADLIETMANFALHPHKIAARGVDPMDFIAEKKTWEDAWRKAGFSTPTMEQQTAVLSRAIGIASAPDDPPPARSGGRARSAP